MQACAARECYTSHVVARDEQAMPGRHIHVHEAAPLAERYLGRSSAVMLCSSKSICTVPCLSSVARRSAVLGPGCFCSWRVPVRARDRPLVAAAVVLMALSDLALRMIWACCATEVKRATLLSKLQQTRSLDSCIAYSAGVL